MFGFGDCEIRDQTFDVDSFVSEFGKLLDAFVVSDGCLELWLCKKIERNVVGFDDYFVRLGFENALELVLFG